MGSPKGLDASKFGEENLLAVLLEDLVDTKDESPFDDTLTLIYEAQL